jgi:glycosyltransferase involved in cell wall biosynthesis
VTVRGPRQNRAVSDAPLLTLTMIVKNEAHGIGRTLASARPHVDRWCIVDTGSTDGTQAAVRSAMGDVPGTLHEEPFTDFATTRNRGIELCGAESDFILWLDADDELQGGPALRRHLAAARPRADRDAYHVQVSMKGNLFDSARVFGSRSAWRFAGVVHEVLTHPELGAPTRRLDGVTVVHHTEAQGEARSRARWERDVALLERETARDPTATRAAFYLGMTLYWLGRNEEAIAALDRRIALGGWAEEVFYATLTKARAAGAGRRPWPEVLVLYLDAHSAAPHRAEPLHDVALQYDARGDHALALLFAKRAYELPLPTQDTLFVEREVYRWRAADLVGAHAYWVGERALGRAAAAKAAAAVPGDARLARNLSFYEPVKTGHKAAGRRR